jgi:ABC-type phosphate transport system permease subunit
MNSNQSQENSTQLKKDLVVAGVCLAGVAALGIYMEKHTRNEALSHFVLILSSMLISVPVVLTLKHNS